jgi:hypothetical protein
MLGSLFRTEPGRVRLDPFIPRKTVQLKRFFFFVAPGHLQVLVEERGGYKL